MKVLFIPDFRGANPYQKLLETSLSRLGVDVFFAKQFIVFPLLKSVVLDRKPDILHMHWTHPFFITNSRFKTLIKLIMFVFDLIYIKALGVKIIWTVHNKYNHEQRYVILDIAISTILATLCNAIKVGCQNAKEEIIKTFRIRNTFKIKIIPDGSYVTIYPNNVNRKFARKTLEINENDFVFLYMGQIRPYKGLLALIDAFEKLNRPQTKLIIAGTPINKEIELEINGKCKRNDNLKTIFKFIPNNEVQIYLNSADVIVLPYTEILSSGSLILAMSFGKPIIAPTIGCIPQVIGDNNRRVLLYNPLKENALLNKMRIAMSVDLERIGKDNFNQASSLFFNWDWIALKTLKLYQNCVNFANNNVVFN